MNYYLIKHLHLLFALTSGIGFGLRGFIRLILNRPLRHKVWRIAPHIVDTLLLASGVVLWATAGWPVFSWLGLKLLLVAVYIAVGVLSFRSRQQGAAVLLYMIALIVFVGIAMLAVNKPFYRKSFQAVGSRGNRLHIPVRARQYHCRQPPSRFIRQRAKTMRLSRPKIFIVLLLAGFLSACSSGPRELLREPLQIRLYELEISDDDLIVRSEERRVNDLPRQLDRIDLELSVDSHVLVATEDFPNLDISARSREILRLTTRAEPDGLQRLEALGQGETTRLPWALQAVVEVDEKRSRPVKSSGWIYRSPGQPNRFR